MSRSVPGRPKKRNTGIVDSGVVQTFYPDYVPGLKLWASADFGAYKDAGITLALNGESVQQWNDQSAEINNMIQLIAGMRPLFITGVINGYPILRCDGVDDFIGVVYGGLLAQPSTIFVIFRFTAGTDQTIFDGNDVGYLNRNALYFDNAASKMTLFAGASVFMNTETIPTPFALYSCYFNGASSELFKNAVSQGVGNAGADAAGGLIVGANAAGVGPMTGDVAEILVYNALVNSTDRGNIQNYLNDKYAIY